MPITPRYADKFLNALMDPHHIYLDAQLWYNDALVGTLPLVSGSVNADRAGDVRRTASLSLDPSILSDSTLAARLNPKGSIVKLWRGVRYPDSTGESYQIFTGRTDSVQTSMDQVNVNCSDMGAFVTDARFTAPYEPYYDNAITDEVQAILKRFDRVVVIHGHTHQLLTNRIGNIHFHGLLSTAWPWPYAPEGMPELTIQMSRPDPFNPTDGCGDGEVPVHPDGLIDMVYNLWNRNPITVKTAYMQSWGKSDAPPAPNRPSY